MTAKRNDRAACNRRGGHTSSDRPYGELPRVGTRPAVGATKPRG